MLQSLIKGAEYSILGPLHPKTSDQRKCDDPKLKSETAKWSTLRNPSNELERLGVTRVDLPSVVLSEHDRVSRRNPSLHKTSLSRYFCSTGLVVGVELKTSRHVERAEDMY